MARVNRMKRAWRIYRECRKLWPALWRRHALRIAWAESRAAPAVLAGKPETRQ